MPLTTSPSSEKRKSVRVEVPLEAAYSSNCPPISARIQDLSDTGLFIDTSHPLTLGTVIDLSFVIPDSNEPIRAKARVVWSAPMMGSGVEFTEISEDDRVRVKFFVAETFFSHH